MKFTNQYQEYKTTGVVKSNHWNHLKNKKNKKERVCKDNRRQTPHMSNSWRSVFCGICGSEDTFSHGVQYCRKCDFEELVYADMDNIGRIEHNCDTKSRIFYFFNDGIYVHECFNCKSVYGPRCPVCKNKLWSNAVSQKCRCQHCGYTK